MLESAHQEAVPTEVKAAQGGAVLQPGRHPRQTVACQAESRQAAQGGDVEWQQRNRVSTAGQVYAVRDGQVAQVWQLVQRLRMDM